MLKEIHPLTRLFWVALVIGVVVYQLNRTEYPGPDRYCERGHHAHGQSEEMFMGERTCHLPIIKFEEGSSQLGINAFQDLAVVADMMMEHPNMTIEVTGKRGLHEHSSLNELREVAVMEHMRHNYNFCLKRIKMVTDDEASFQHPHHERHHAHKHEHHHDHHHGHHGRKDKKKHRKHKHHTSKLDRAVYITCIIK